MVYTAVHVTPSSQPRRRGAEVGLLALAFAAALAACGGNEATFPDAGGGRPDGGAVRPDTGSITPDTGMMTPDTGTGGPDGATPDTGTPEPDGGTMTPDGGAMPTACMGTRPAPAESGTCRFVPGNAGLLIFSDFLGPTGVVENGRVLVSPTGIIQCAGCDCDARPEATGVARLECATGLLSPGLVNAHDHVTFNEGPPAAPRTERYEHRHDWRTGRNNHTRIPSPRNQGGEQGVRYHEIRSIMAGTTAINGSGTAAGLIRNLDRAAGLEGLAQPAVKYETFPLDDSNGTTQAMTCNYGNGRDTASVLNGTDAYTPHVSEGIDIEALNEFLCTSGESNGSVDIVTAKTGVIHGLGLRPRDYQRMAAVGASLIWSPRSNIDLYGMTAAVTVADRAGVRIALGTDWVATGSMNMLRELRCADDWNRLYLGGYFTDRQLVQMATENAAASLASDDYLGVIAPGKVADLALFDARTDRGYRAVLNASADDVVLVWRGGEALYGDAPLLAALNANLDGCDQLDVCGRQKAVCVERDTGANLTQILAAIRTDAYALFFCGEPTNEPTCLPTRPGEFTGMSRADDRDGDGMADATDLCPTVFDAPREFENGMQGNADGDALADVCDPCPTDANSTTCSRPNPDDRDGDGVPNAMDKCPTIADPMQLDGDMDGTGDACDACPAVANPAGAPCPATVYDVKRGLVSGPVQLRGVVVTAVAANGYFAQMVSASPGWDAGLGARFSGVFVFTGATGTKPTRGDQIDVSGTVTEFFGQTQLTNASFSVVTRNFPMPPTPVVVAAADVGAYGTGAAPGQGVARPQMPYEAVLVELRGLTVSNADPDPGPGDRRPTNEFTVDGNVRVDDLLFAITPAPAVGQRFPSIVGVLRIANEWAKLCPRDAADVAAAPTLLGFDPASLTVPQGLNGVPAGGFRVRLTRSATIATTVRLTSSSADLAAPMMVSIPSGADAADVSLVALRSSTVAHTITAILGNARVTARVRVFDPNAPRQLASLTLASTALAPGAGTMGTISLDLPARAGGEQVTLTLSSPAAGQLSPSTVTVAANQTSASFSLTAGTSTGTYQLTGTLGLSQVSVSFLVTRSQRRAVSAPGDLVITEVLYNPSGASETAREWFEVHNPTPDELLLDGLVFRDNNGSFTVPMGRTIAPGGYLVFAANADPALNGGIQGAIGYGTTIALANGGDRIQLAVGNVTIDEINWTSMWPGSTDGSAMCLEVPYGDNGVPASWSRTVGSFGTSADRGTPGVASDATNCP